jgi:hypothetical protein
MSRYVFHHLVPDLPLLVARAAQFAASHRCYDRSLPKFGPSSNIREQGQITAKVGIDGKHYREPGAVFFAFTRTQGVPQAPSRTFVIKALSMRARNSEAFVHTCVETIQKLNRL